MIIDYISDLHIDTWNITIETFIEKVFKNKKSDYLIIAGDTSSFIKNTKDFLKKLSPLYKSIFIVMGNHDLYQEIHKGKHYNTFLKKYELLKKELSFDNVVFLDGQLITIEDKVISGLSMWYSEDYIQDKKLFERYWYSFMLDSRETSSFQDSFNFYENQVLKLEKIADNKIDLFCSHVKPLINDEYFADKYKHSSVNTFFCFNGEKYIKNIRHWIFGHTHDQKDFKHKGVRFLCNPLGYPNENKRVTDIFISNGFLKQIEI